MPSRRHAALHIPGGKLIDLHAHLYAGQEESNAREMIEEVEWLGGDAVTVMVSYINCARPNENLKTLQRGNDLVARWASASNGRLRGMVYLNPRHGQKAVDELRRCYDVHGMRMAKLWCSAPFTDPRVFPILERCIDLKIPLLQHAFCNACGNMPNESYPWDVAATARRYPEARILMAHISGDYMMGVGSIRDVPNVWTEVCGSYCEAGAVETAVRELGAARLAFGTDNGIAFNLGKVQDARISEKDKERVLYLNAKELLS